MTITTVQAQNKRNQILLNTLTRENSLLTGSANTGFFYNGEMYFADDVPRNTPGRDTKKRLTNIHESLHGRFQEYQADYARERVNTKTLIQCFALIHKVHSNRVHILSALPDELIDTINMPYRSNAWVRSTPIKDWVDLHPEAKEAHETMAELVEFYLITLRLLFG